tara:strand:+ start:314 stop:781 length:468 start_codon:yes stop_codon:yes gene_type:complete
MVKSNKQYQKEEARYQRDMDIIKKFNHDKHRIIDESNKKLERMRDKWLKRRMKEVEGYQNDGMTCVERSFWSRKEKGEPDLTMKQYKEEIHQVHLTAWNNLHGHKFQVYIESGEEEETTSESDEEEDMSWLNYSSIDNQICEEMKKDEKHKVNTD